MKTVLSGSMFEPAKHEYWESHHDKDGAHYNIYGIAVGGMTRNDLGMDALRQMFPDGEADEMNLCLFSTSGVHGGYTTIEEAEASLLNPPEWWTNEYPGKPYQPEVTFLIVHPRIVCLRYGNCQPRNADDFAFLKKLRESSWHAFQQIGKHEAE